MEVTYILHGTANHLALKEGPANLWYLEPLATQELGNLEYSRVVVLYRVIVIVYLLHKTDSLLLLRVYWDKSAHHQLSNL